MNPLGRVGGLVALEWEEVLLIAVISFLRVVSGEGSWIALVLHKMARLDPLVC